MFTGDIVEYHSACYCGDGHFGDWPATLDAIRAFGLDAIAPGRGDALVGDEDGRTRRSTRPRDFLDLDLPARSRGSPPRGGSLKEAWDAVPRRMRSEILRLRDLRALPAVQRRPRL